MKNNLNALIILNVVVCVLSFGLGLAFFVLTAVANLGVLFHLRSKDEDDLMENKHVLFILGLIDILTLKWISGAICISMFSNLSNDYKYKKHMIKKKEEVKVDPQIRKVDILLKLGEVMVFIAGFVFATTGWYSLSSIIKLFIFLGVSLLFIGLSKFSEKHIKIKSTVYLYWILGMSFIAMMVFTAGFGNVFGEYFSFNGDGCNLYLAFCSLVIAGLGLITYFNFKDKLFLNIVYAGILFGLLFICEHIGLLFETFLAIVLPIVTLIRFINIDREKDLYTLYLFSNILLCILGIIFICFTGTYVSVVPVMIVSLLFIFNLYSYIFINKESDFNMFASLIAYVLIIPVIVLIANKVSDWVIISVLFVTCLYLISLLFNNKQLKNSSLIIADMITILSFVISTEEYFWLPLVVACFSTLICLVCTFVDKLDDYSFEVFIHPIKLAMLLFGAIFVLDHYIEITNIMGYWMSSTLIIYIIIYCLSKNDTLTDIYEKFSIVAIILCLLFTTTINNIIISILIFVAIVIFYADVNWVKKKSSAFNMFSYIILLFNIFISMRAIENSLTYYQIGFEVDYLFANIVTIVLFGLMAFFHREDEGKLNIALFAVLLPLLSMIDTCSIEWVSIILPSMLVYYLTFIITRLEKRDLVTKNVLGYIGYSFSFILIIFSSNHYVLAYSFIILFVSLLVGYLDKTYNALFRTSVVGLLALIIYQLKEFWNIIPAWLYLLVLGLILIIFATYKQLKIVENNEKNEKDGKK